MEETYLDMLKQEYLDRKERRPQYSERAFARDLKLSSGFISLLFNNKRRLSPRMSVKVLENLSWPEQKSQKFLESVQKQQLEQRPKKTTRVDMANNFEMDVDYFRLLANINHVLVLEFIQTREVKTVQEISNYFDLSDMECEMVVKRLERLRLVQRTEEGFEALNQSRQLKGTPSHAIRKYHKESIIKSLESVDTQDFEERELRSVTLSLKPELINEAKKSIDKFVRAFVKKYGDVSDGEIYQLNLQLFSHKKKDKGI